MKKIRILSASIIFFLIIISDAAAQIPQVAFAGMAYSGNENTILSRFKYSILYQNALSRDGEKSYTKIQNLITNIPPKNLLLIGQIDELKGKDQALVVSLLITSETVSIEKFGNIRKLFVLIRGQTLFFDFKSMTVVRAYPLSFAYIDTFEREPTEAEIVHRIRLVYEGTTNKPGIFSRFASSLVSAALPSNVPRYLQVANVNMTPEFLASIPEYLKETPETAKSWAADLAGEAISNRIGIPIIPYIKGYAIGNVMSMRISDGNVYTLNLPKPDYEISLDLVGLKKIKYGEVSAGASFIYGSYVNIRVEEPLTGKVYMNTALKNGEVKVVPVTQTYVDDFPAFYDSVNNLFGKLAESVNGKNNTWIKTASTASDIETQIVKTRELMNLCK